LPGMRQHGLPHMGQQHALCTEPRVIGVDRDTDLAVLKIDSDKDLPTMWENCYYVGGTDDGRLWISKPSFPKRVIFVIFEFLKMPT